MSARKSCLDWLRSDEGLIKQLQWNLFVLRVYLPTKRQFERQYPVQRTTKAIETNHRPRSGQLKFPNLPKILAMYNIMSSILLLWVFLKYLIPNQVNILVRFFYYQLLNRWDSLPVQEESHCFSFGRLVVHYGLTDEIFGCLLASYHICWRLVQATLNRPYSLDVLLFLLQPREDIERFIEKLEAANEGLERSQRRQRRLSMPFRSDTTPLGLKYNHLSDQERLLCDIMCYEVTFVDISDNDDGENDDDDDDVVFRTPPRVLYRLRPNRTLEARQRLVDWLTAWSLILICGFLVVAFGVTLYISYVVLFNQRRYYRDFAGCDQQFEQLYKSGHIKQWSFPHLTSHRLAAIIGDIVENGFIWTESGLAGMFTLMFANYLNQDLLNYWAQLEEDIRLSSLKSKKMHCFFHYQTYRARSTDRILRESHEEIFELQAKLSDFFHQIQQVDLLVSDIITYALMVWLSGFGIISFKSAEFLASTKNSEFAIIWVATSLIFFLGYSLASVPLLYLQRRCHLCYLDVCSMMAYDQSKYKKHFGPLIQSFSDKNRACYTWFQQVPFSSRNFLSVIGWSFTGFLMLDSVFNRR